MTRFIDTIAGLRRRNLDSRSARRRAAMSLFADPSRPDRTKVAAIVERLEGRALLTAGIKIGNVTVNPPSQLDVTAGNATTFTIAIDRQSSDGNTGTKGAFDATLSISGLPDGVTATFDEGSTTVSFSPTDNTKTVSLTLQTSSSTPAGDYDLTVTATRTDRSTDTASGPATLGVIVLPPPPPPPAPPNGF